MTGQSEDWLGRYLTPTDVASLDEIGIQVTPTRRLSMADSLRAWNAQVDRLIREKDSSTEDGNVWGPFDLVAALLTRDRVARLLPEVPERLRSAVSAVLVDVDRRYEEYSELDDCGCVERVEERPAPEGAWWWHRVPKSGPVLEELRLYYHHPSEPKS